MRFHYLEWGDLSGPRVVLLHGLGTNGHSWDRGSKVLAQKYRVLALDCRNHGDSDTTTDATMLNQLSNDVGEIVDKLGIGKFGLIGLSMGGRTAMTYTGFNPERVERLVIEDIGPEAPPAHLARGRAPISPYSFTDFGHPAEYIEFQRKGRPHASQEWLEHLAQHSLIQQPTGRWMNKFRPFHEGRRIPGDLAV